MTTVMSILGGEKELGQIVRQPIDFDTLIKTGMPSGVLAYIKKKFNLPDEIIARITGVSPRTIARRRKALGASNIGRLSPVESDRIYRFARIIALTEDVFDGQDEALEWLNSPQHGVGGATPFDLLQTDAGAREVEELLVRIDYGVIS